MDPGRLGYDAVEVHENGIEGLKVYGSASSGRAGLWRFLIRPCRVHLL
jgi:hypothetical protein